MSFDRAFWNFTGRDAREVPSRAREVIAWRNDGGANDAIRIADRCKSPVSASRRGALVARPGAMKAMAEQRIAERRDEHMLSISEPYAPTVWPDPSVPQQMHFDVMVEDVEAATPYVIDLGATELAGHGVFADPAGHPFCLIPRPKWAPPIQN